MKNRVCLMLVICAQLAIGQQWQLALPGYQYQFPRDYFDHPGYQTEWWYYTGNFRAQNGRRYGFELTFFREGVHLLSRAMADEDPVWTPNQIYLAHLALSDIDGKTFYHTERLNRGGPGLAGASLAQQRYWNGNWEVSWSSLTGAAQHLQAVCDRFTLELDLTPQKPAVINGKYGISQKGPRPGEASHYLSFTRIAARGTLDRDGRTETVTGLAWMDHEYFSERLDRDLAGWDWFAVQLDNNEELMLYRLRTKSGKKDPYSSGTFVETNGRSHLLTAADFSLAPGEVWHSRQSRSSYPVSWTISVPSLQLTLSERTTLDDQELYSDNSISPSYWEGAVTYSGVRAGHVVTGVGYLEMTGYGQPLRFGD